MADTDPRIAAGHEAAHPDRIAISSEPIDYTCPTCLAEPGAMCTNDENPTSSATFIHASRIEAASAMGNDKGSIGVSKEEFDQVASEFI